MMETYRQLITRLVQESIVQSYRNIESLNALQKRFAQLVSIRRAISLLHPGFPADLSVSIVIDDLARITTEKAGKKTLEWTFDHYNDLFNFKAERLLNDMDRTENISHANRV